MIAVFCLVCFCGSESDLRNCSRQWEGLPAFYAAHMHHGTYVREYGHYKVANREAAVVASPRSKGRCNHFKEHKVTWR